MPPGCLLVLVLLALSACNAPPIAKPVELPTVDEARALRASYEDVDFHGCVTLADFQSPSQVRWFRAVGADGSELHAIRHSITASPEAADPAERALGVLLRGPKDFLILDPTGLPQLDAPADWRDFGVLVFRLHAPPGGVQLRLFILGAADDSLGWAQDVHANAGWNLLRVDLDEVGRYIDLANVHTLGWRLAEGAGPTTVYIDDLVLANRAAWRMGQHAAAGELCVCTRGDRLIVGARERFELVFAGGAIVAWYADSPDSLTVPTGMGPWLLPLPADWRTQQVVTLTAERFRPSSASRPSVLEASPLRVIVAGGAEPTAARYVVYPDGRVYVHSRTPSVPATDDAQSLGWALVLASRSAFRLTGPSSTYAYNMPADFALLCRNGPLRADLLWACATPGALAQRRLIQPHGRQPLVLLAGESATPEAAHLLRVWPRNMDGDDQAGAAAADYQNPARLSVTAGRLVTDAAGDLNGDGFNESEGCYELEPQHGVLRFEFDPGVIVRERPLFRVRDTAGRQCWIYVDGKALLIEHHDADGNVVFALDGNVRMPRAIEVYTQSPGDPR